MEVPLSGPGGAVVEDPIEELQRLCVRNVDRLELMANALEYNDSNKSNLMEQRNELLQSHIGA